MITAAFISITILLSIIAAVLSMWIVSEKKVVTGTIALIGTTIPQGIIIEKWESELNEKIFAAGIVLYCVCVSFVFGVELFRTMPGFLSGRSFERDVDPEDFKR